MFRRILIAADSVKKSKHLSDYLERNRYSVDCEEREENIIEDIIKRAEHELLILDKVFSNISIIKICESIRKFSDCAIIVIRSEVDALFGVRCLDAGADDYLSGDPEPDEIRARVDAVLRRKNFCNKYFLENSIIEVEDLKINTLGRVVDVGGKTVNLTAKEFDLLILLATNRGQVYSRELLLDKIWGYDEYFADVRTVDVHIRRLRKKIERDPSKPFYVITRWGAGYYFREA